jgi:hypothetical protein
MAARDPSRRMFRGIAMSAADLAKRLGISPRRVRAYWAECRVGYEARSLSRQRPWELEGVSRRTWYRRRRAEVI